MPSHFFDLVCGHNECIEEMESIPVSHFLITIHTCVQSRIIYLVMEKSNTCHCTCSKPFCFNCVNIITLLINYTENLGCRFCPENNNSI